MTQSAPSAPVSNNTPLDDPGRHSSSPLNSTFAGKEIVQPGHGVIGDPQPVFRTSPQLEETSIQGESIRGINRITPYKLKLRLIRLIDNESSPRRSQSMSTQAADLNTSIAPPKRHEGQGESFSRAIPRTLIKFTS